MIVSGAQQTLKYFYSEKEQKIFHRCDIILVLKPKANVSILPTANDDSSNLEMSIYMYHLINPDLCTYYTC